jgi:2-iminoacetate synthase
MIKELYTCNYLDSRCVNACSYCNYGEKGISLSVSEIAKETDWIKDNNISNQIFIAGSIPEKKYLERLIKSAVISMEKGITPWVEFDTLSYDGLKKLKKEGVNHFILFQETYDVKTYELFHKSTLTKKKFFERLEKIDTAVDVGFENIGIGALFGLTENYVTEIVGLCQHADYLLSKGINVYINAPTINHQNFQKVSDWEIVAIYAQLKRLLPDAKLMLSSRENPEVRDVLFPFVDLIGTGGVTIPGGRTSNLDKNEQFSLLDKRTPKEIRLTLENMGFKVG